jgi:hypothetical protein
MEDQERQESEVEVQEQQAEETEVQEETQETETQETQEAAVEETEDEQTEDSSPSDPVEEVASEPQVFKPKNKKVPLSELQKERQRRREAEESRIRLEQELQDIRSTVNTIKSKEAVEQEVQDAMNDLGLDEENARKLVAYNQKREQRTKGNTLNQDAIQRLQKDFVKKVQDASTAYHDWSDYGSEMQKEFEKEYQQNGVAAFKKSPDYYYALAKTNKSVHQQGQREMANKINQKNLASMESSKVPSSKPKPKVNLMDELKKHSGDTDWWEKNKARYDEALAKGEI